MLKHPKYKRGIALFLAVMVLVSAAATVVGVTYPGATEAVKRVFNPNAVSDADKKTAEDLSDMTGISPYRLQEMKNESGSWDAVMQTIQKDGAEKSDISDDALKDLISEFSKEEVDEATALVSRVIFNLREINAKADTNNVPAAALVTPKPVDQIQEEAYDFKKVEGLFAKNTAIYLILKTKASLGSYEQALDEYLYCLQIDVDFKLFLADEEDYEKQVAQKGAQLTREKAVSVMVIEEEMLGLLTGAKDKEEQKGNEKTDPLAAIKANDPAKQDGPDIAAPKLPDSGMPKVENPKPADPAADVYAEIDKIKQGSNPYTR